MLLSGVPALSGSSVEPVEPDSNCLAVVIDQAPRLAPPGFAERP